MELPRNQQVKIRVPDHLHKALRLVSLDTGLSIQLLGEFGLLWTLRRTLKKHGPGSIPPDLMERLETDFSVYENHAAANIMGIEKWES